MRPCPATGQWDKCNLWNRHRIVRSYCCWLCTARRSRPRRRRYPRGRRGCAGRDRAEPKEPERVPWRRRRGRRPRWCRRSPPPISGRKRRRPARGLSETAGSSAAAAVAIRVLRHELAEAPGAEPALIGVDDGRVLQPGIVGGQHLRVLGDRAGILDPPVLDEVAAIPLFVCRWIAGVGLAQVLDGIDRRRRLVLPGVAVVPAV